MLIYVKMSTIVGILILIYDIMSKIDLMLSSTEHEKVYNPGPGSEVIKLFAC